MGPEVQSLRPAQLPVTQRESILAKIGGKKVDTFPEGDLVWNSLKTGFAIGVFSEADPSPAEKERKPKGGEY